MVIFLTSSPTGPLDNSRFVDGIDEKNQLIGNLRKYWKSGMRALYITASPADTALNDEIQRGMAATFERKGFPFDCFDVWDDRTVDFSEQVLNSYDLIFLGGGHVPTQNEFLQRIGLRKKIRSFAGVIMGISAGTMNSADIVYAQPEMPGEAADPCYQKFLQGLGLTQIMVLPHYQMTKHFELDGMRLFEEITYGDSMGREFIALPDGSYILSEDGVETIWGEAYRIADGKIEKICEENETLRW